MTICPYKLVIIGCTLAFALFVSTRQDVDVYEVSERKKHRESIDTRADENGGISWESWVRATPLLCVRGSRSSRVVTCHARVYKKSTAPRLKPLLPSTTPWTLYAS